jgi:hypothetical protein
LTTAGDHHGDFNDFLFFGFWMVKFEISNKTAGAQFEKRKNETKAAKQHHHDCTSMSNNAIDCIQTTNACMRFLLFTSFYCTGLELSSSSPAETTINV